jgi:hypothetical protein
MTREDLEGIVEKLKASRQDMAKVKLFVAKGHPDIELMKEYFEVEEVE